jgi:hypothetical protein
MMRASDTAVAETSIIAQEPANARGGGHLSDI